MARRKTAKAAVKDSGQEFLDTLRELGRERGIEEEVLFEAIEAALISAYKRPFPRDRRLSCVRHQDRGGGDGE